MENLPAIAVAISLVSLLVTILMRSNTGVATFAKVESRQTLQDRDINELKAGFLKLNEALTQLAVIQAKQASDASEIQRIRERLHDIESNQRGLLAWRQSEDPNYGKRS